LIEEADNGLSFMIRDLLQRLQGELSALDSRITDVTCQLARLSHELEACQRLQEMEGIGPLSATALVAALGHGHDLQTGRQVAAWLGLVPRQHSSGGTTR
jgi:transposase